MEGWNGYNVEKIANERILTGFLKILRRDRVFKIDALLPLAPPCDLAFNNTRDRCDFRNPVEEGDRTLRLMFVVSKLSPCRLRRVGLT